MKHRWTEDEKRQAIDLYLSGLQAWEVADEMGISRDAVRHLMHNAGVNKAPDACLRCGGELVHPPTGRKRTYCSDYCRNFTGPAVPPSYEIECAFCGKRVVVHSSHIITCEEHRADRHLINRRSYENGTSGFGHFLDMTDEARQRSRERFASRG